MSPRFEVELQPSFSPVVSATIAEVPQGLLEQLDALKIWDLPEHGGQLGLDGTNWSLRWTRGDQTRTVSRWEPEPGRFRTACLVLLRHAGAEAIEEVLTVEETWVAEEIRELTTRTDVEFGGTSAQVYSAIGAAVEALRTILGRLEGLSLERQRLLHGQRDPEIYTDRLSVFEALAADKALVVPLLAATEKDPLSQYVIRNYKDRATKDESVLLSRVRSLRGSTNLVLRHHYLGVLRQSLPGGDAGIATKKVAQGILDREGDAIVINRCAKCQRFAESPTSTRCVPCGHDWSEQPRGALRIKLCPNDQDPLQEWDSQTRCWTCGWPRKAHRHTCPECQAALLTSSDLQPPCEACGWPYAKA
jgi:hypothetical protein